MVKVSDLISYGSENLKSVADNPRNEARILLSHILSLSTAALFLRQDQQVSQDNLNLFKKYIDLRKKHMPIAYIIQKKDFYGLTFKVDNNTLIPRPETEFLVDEILSLGKKTLLDLCTGSGCIPIATARNSDIVALGVDISSGAIDIARQNASKYGISNRVTFELFDIFQKSFFGKFDMISSNPPYITKADMNLLQPDVLKFEPHAALDGGKDGLDFYRRIIEIAPQNLNPDGYLIFELGIGQAESVLNLMKENFTDIKITKDLAGIDRVISGRIKGDKYV